MVFRVELVNLPGIAAAVEKDLEVAVKSAVAAATEAMKDDVREATWRAFSMSNRLPKAWRSQVYPRNAASMDAAGVVYVRKTAADIIRSASEAITIRARGGKWLAIPTPDAGRFGVRAGATGSLNRAGNRERITPAGFERRTGIKLRFVPDRGGQRAFLIADAAMRRRGIIAPYQGRGRGSRLYGPAGRSIVAFVLVRSVTTRKRLDLQQISQRAASRGLDIVLPE